MTPLMQQAIDEIQKLPEQEQDEMATWILEEIADGRRWQKSFACSQDKLAMMAIKAREDIRDGRVKSGGFDQL